MPVSPGLLTEFVRVVDRRAVVSARVGGSVQQGHP